MKRILTITLIALSLVFGAGWNNVYNGSIFELAELDGDFRFAVWDEVGNERGTVKLIDLSNKIQNDIWKNGEFDLATELENNDIVFVPAGIHTISDSIELTSGKSIYGVRGKSILSFNTENINNCIIIDGVSNVTIENLTIIGDGDDTQMDGNNVASGVIDNITDAENLNEIGTKTGIYISNSSAISINNVEVSNFDAYGIFGTDYGSAYFKTGKLTRLFIHDCYVGLNVNQRYEYNTISNCQINKCQIGIIGNGGNNYFDNCVINGNRIGLVMEASSNDSHGSFVGCSFNHNSLYGMFINNIQYGEIISCCNIWYADIYIKDSKGLKISDCILSNVDIYADGNFVDGGMCIMNDCMIRSSTAVTIYEDYLGNISNFKMLNNFTIDASDSSRYNN